MSRRWLALLLFMAAPAFAAVDTRDKRASAANVGQSVLTLPNPDGTISTADRAMLAGEYSGLAAGEPPPPGEGRLKLRLDLRITISQRTEQDAGSRLNEV
jgi:hypothetical protein